MKVALVHDAKFPVAAYGGTERVVWWLSKGLYNRGIDTVLVSRPGSSSPYAEVRSHDFSKPLVDVEGVDLLHFFYNPVNSESVKKPFLATIGGNGKATEFFPENTVFVSRNHAERHGASAFVYNGVDPEEYIFARAKERYLLFLAKASWNVKNLRGSIRIARRAKIPLRVVGTRPFPRYWRGVFREGMLGGERKASLIASASALLFPVLWNEPFGLAIVESLVSGTPVLATPFGSLPELVSADVGRLCSSELEFVQAASTLGEYKPDRCREWAIANFHYDVMTESYLKLYSEVLNGRPLNATKPRAIQAAGLLSLREAIP
jgi:glycosyltransferase involved in cell wall biosynthesis